jgi:hypothetical protein
MRERGTERTEETSGEERVKMLKTENELQN